MFSVRLIKAEGLRRILVILFYFAFTITMFYCMIHTISVNDRILYSLLWLFVPFGIWYEIIRFQYTVANEALHQSCCPAAVLSHIRFVRRADFLGRYRLQAAYLESAALIDQNRIDDSGKLIAGPMEKLIQTGKNLNFEYNYLRFTICAVQKDKKQIKGYYSALERIFQVQKKFHTDVLSLKSSIEGTYYLTEGRLADAKKAFARVLPESLGNHERAWHYYYLSRLHFQANEPRAAEEAYKKALSLAPEITLFSDRSLFPAGTVKR